MKSSEFSKAPKVKSYAHKGAQLTFLKSIMSIATLWSGMSLRSRRNPISQSVTSAPKKVCTRWSANRDPNII
ncbi:hypothetical protein C0J52_16111 [Blattella germanica]|nr:hypothetical protein C0J52_16111 [Blattella germanica]